MRLFTLCVLVSVITVLSKCCDEKDQHWTDGFLKPAHFAFLSYKNKNNWTYWYQLWPQWLLFSIHSEDLSVGCISIIRFVRLCLFVCWFVEFPPYTLCQGTGACTRFCAILLWKKSPVRGGANPSLIWELISYVHIIHTVWCSIPVQSFGWLGNRPTMTENVWSKI